MENSTLIPFEGKEIRKAWYNEQWYFSVVDIIEHLTDSPKPTAYWNKVQKALEAESELYPFWIKLKLIGQDGKARPSDCANTEGVLRIAMSVPSPKQLFQRIIILKRVKPRMNYRLTQKFKFNFTQNA